jgi:hypothetical protein
VLDRAHCFAPFTKTVLFIATDCLKNIDAGSLIIVHLMFEKGRITKMCKSRGSFVKLWKVILLSKTPVLAEIYHFKPFSFLGGNPHKLIDNGVCVYVGRVGTRPL